MKLMPVHCCIIWMVMPRKVRRRFEAGLEKEPEKHAAHDEYQLPVGMSCASTSALATISASSASMNRDVGGWLRMRARAERAWSMRPRLTKYRGESGRNSSPQTSARAQMYCGRVLRLSRVRLRGPPFYAAERTWRPIGMRYAADPGRFRENLVAMEAIMSPTVLKNSAEGAHVVSRLSVVRMRRFLELATHGSRRRSGRGICGAQFQTCRG